MLKLEHYVQNSDRLWTAIIQGPYGRIQLCDLVWVEDREDLLAIYYREAWGVLQGAYHCCFSVPGKVTLL
jgi:hypothetical protein